MTRRLPTVLLLLAAALPGCRREARPESLPMRSAAPAVRAEYRNAEHCAREWGLTYRYNPGSQHAVFSDAARELICCPGLRSALIDGIPLRLQSPVEMRAGQLMLPDALVAAADRAWAGRPPAPQERPPVPALPAVPPSPRYRIVLDPGHGGGILTGAQGVGGTFEKDVNLAIALQLKPLLEARGAEVVLLREGDRPFYRPAQERAAFRDDAEKYNALQKADLEERVRLANLARGDLFVSIHANLASNPDAEGFEVWYPRSPSAPPPPPSPRRRGRRSMLDWSAYGEETTQVLDRLSRADRHEEARWRDSRALAESVRRALRGSLSAPDRGSKMADHKVTRCSNAPAILVETGFLSNPDEERRLNTAAYQKRVAEALADGIGRFMASRR